MRCRVTLSTYGVTLGDELITMGVVAVGANDTSLMHFTLDEGAIDLSLIHI